MIWTIIGLIVGVTLVDVYFETNFPKLNVIDIKAKRPLAMKRLKAIQITDYHNFKHNNRVLKLIKKADADIIFITGDIVDATTKDYKNVYKFVESLIKINPNIYYVPGNHELRSENMEVLFKELQERKVRVMLNDNERFKVENSEINICGMDFSSSERSDLAKTVEGINTDNYTIMLSHKPDIVIKYQDMPCDLILCGHTHGGQIRLPLIGALIAPDQGMLPKYNKGLYKISDKTFLYVDSGTGTTRLPVRFFNRSQVSLINIEK